MARKYFNVLCILLSLYALRLLWVCSKCIKLHMTTSFEIDSESEHWGRSRVGSPKIINRYGGATATKGNGLSSRLREETQVKLPPSCKKIGICDHAPDYPEDLVKSLLDDFIKQNGPKVFNNDVLLTSKPSLSERINGYDDMVMCKSDKMLYTPQLARTATEDLHYIVNLKLSRKQSFQVEICETENVIHHCIGILSRQRNFTGECKQEYALREMVAVDMKNERLIIQQFQVPSCCSCLAKRSYRK